MNRAILALLISAALWLVLWQLSRLTYARCAPGIPDSGMLPSAAVPLAFPLYGSIRLWSSFDMLIVWVLCCSLFVAPQFAAFALATSPHHFAWLGATSFVEWLLCLRVLWSLSYADYGYSFGFAAGILAILLTLGATLGRLFRHANSKIRNA